MECQKSFLLSREMVPVKNPEEVGLKTGWRNIVSFARILAGRFVFSFQCRDSFSFSLSLLGSFALSAVFIRLYLRLRFTVIAYVNDRGEKIKKDCRRVKNACIHLSVLSLFIKHILYVLNFKNT